MPTGKSANHLQAVPGRGDPDQRDNRRAARSMADNEVADLNLAELAAAGDRQAFEAIYHRQVNRVYGLCLRLTADQAEAEILTQDTFVKAWTAIGGYSGRGSLGGWLGRIAVNLRRDGFRQMARRERLMEDAASDGTPTEFDSRAVIPLLAAMDLEKGIAGLPPGARTVFVLYEIEGYAHKEIAGLLDVAIGTVKAQLHRARHLLRNSLSDKKEFNHET